MLGLLFRRCRTLLLVLLLPTSLCAADTDGDGLKDVIDALGFDRLLSRKTDPVQFRGVVEDLDGLPLLNHATEIQIHSRVQNLTPGDFHGLDRLEILDLHSNRIAHIHRDDLVGLPASLRELSFNNNLLRHIEPGAFRALAGLRQLGLRENELRSLEGAPFAGLASLTELDLSRNFLNELGSDAFAGLPRVRAINLRENTFVALEHDFFVSASQISSLDLSHNGIQSIEPGTFEALKSLTQLKLDNNPFQQLEPGAFRGLAHFEDFRLGTKMKVLPVGLFEGLSGAITLSLTSAAQELQRGTFLHLPSLRHLTVVGGWITEVRAGAFADVPELRSLQLADNMIRTLPAGAFEGLGELQELHLWNNFVEHIELDVFAQLPQLKRLRLDGNHLTAVEPRWFLEQQRLEDLSLASNFLTVIRREDLRHLPALTRLDLANNEITHLENEVFGQLDQLEWLTLQDNPIEALNLEGATLPSLHTLAVDDQVVALRLDFAKLGAQALTAILGATSGWRELSLLGTEFAEDVRHLAELAALPTLKRLSLDREVYRRFREEVDALAVRPGVVVEVLPSGDCSGDGAVSAADIACIGSLGRRDAVLKALGTLPGDLDGNGTVGFADFLTLASNYGATSSSYADGNIDLMGGVGFPDFLVLAANFSSPPGKATVPVPGQGAGWLVVLVWLSRCPSVFTRRNVMRPKKLATRCEIG